MAIVSVEMQQAIEKLLSHIGGIDNINRLFTGKKNLLAISVKHFEYVKINQLQQLDFVEDIMVRSPWIFLSTKGFTAPELAITFKLYEQTVYDEAMEELEESVLDRLFTYLRHIFMPLLPALIGGGILQALIVIAITFGFFSDFTSSGAILTTISGAVFYILPVLVAYSSANYHKTNPYLAVCAIGILIHPLVTSFITVYILEGALDLQLISGSYSNSILPVLLIIPVQSYLEKKLDHYLSVPLLIIAKPVILLMLTLFLGIFLFLPVMTLSGNALVAILHMVAEVAPWLVTTLLGVLGPILIMFGAHHSLLPYIMQVLENDGFDLLLGPSMLVVNFAHVGVALAVMLRTQKKTYRTYCASALVVALMGVSQPTLFGIDILLKRTLVYVMIAGGVGGLLAGIFHLKAFRLANPSIASLSIFSDGTSNLAVAIFCISVSFTTAFLLTWRMAFDEPTDEEMMMKEESNT